MNFGSNSKRGLIVLGILVLGLGLAVGFASYEAAHHDHGTHDGACWACTIGVLGAVPVVGAALFVPVLCSRFQLLPATPAHAGMPLIERRRGPPRLQLL